MADLWLECVRCQACIPFGAEFRGCQACRLLGYSSPVEVRYKSLPNKLTPGPSQRGVWTWADWLPFVPGAATLQEGDSPLLQLSSGLYVKNETRNPTWSWKDRPNAVTAAVAKHFGYQRLAVISTGNHGVAAAAYSALNQLDCTIFCHPDAPQLCTSLMERFGARVVRGGNQELLLSQALEQPSTYPGTTLDAMHGYTNPFGIEGFKTIAFEIVVQLGGVVPNRVYIPTGSGDGIAGIWKGFRELRDSGIVSTTPKMVACQAAGANSLELAMNSNATAVAALNIVKTKALSIGEFRTGDHALSTVRASGGTVRTVADDKAVAAAKRLARHGLATELSSAVAYCCAEQDLPAIGSETWVVIGSGAITKWPADLDDR